MSNKNIFSRELVDLKIKWWTLVEGKEYSSSDKDKLHKIIYKHSIKDIKEQIEFYNIRFARAKELSA